MKIVLFVHSIVSDWSHGNAHFLRGLMRALTRRGHDVVAGEPAHSWSVNKLYESEGHGPIVDFARVFPDLAIRTYRGGRDVLEEVDEITKGADLVLVHEFNEPELVGAVGHLRRRRGDFLLLFHDTHHRAASAPHQLLRLNLEAFDGVLAFGRSLAGLYRRDFGKARVWTFHEAADTSLFRPLESAKENDVVWIGNWGDDERTLELHEYLVRTAEALPELSFAVHGVRYPDASLRALDRAGIRFHGWIPNHRVPEVFARSRMTLHIPRGPYLDRLPGIPTIRPFEAMACGIPLLSTFWPDVEGLFRAGHDYVAVRTPAEMRHWIRRLVVDVDEAERIGRNALQTIRNRHTCEHRALELEGIAAELGAVLPAVGRRTGGNRVFTPRPDPGAGDAREAAAPAEA